MSSRHQPLAGLHHRREHQTAHVVAAFGVFGGLKRRAVVNLISPLWDTHLHQARTMKKTNTKRPVELFGGTWYFRTVMVFRLPPSGSQVIKYAFRSVTSSGWRSGICQV
jgi:hypothetical protein